MDDILHRQIAGKRKTTSVRNAALAHGRLPLPVAMALSGRLPLCRLQNGLALIYG